MNSQPNQEQAIKDPFDLLTLSIDESILVRLKNGRRLVGKLHAYDLHLNMVLGDVEETVTDIDIDDETYEEILLVTKRVVPMLFVRGDGIILISPPKGKDIDGFFYPFDAIYLLGAEILDNHSHVIRALAAVMKPDSALDGNIPVFVFPSAINFYLEDYGSHKQVLTIYNPYEFPLRFKVLCTDPRKYNVIDPEGCIKRGCCIDIVIRLVAVNPAYLNRVDTFRIQMLDQGSKQILGKRDVLATFFPGGSPESSKHPQAENEDFKSLPGGGNIGSTALADRSRQLQNKQSRSVDNRPQGRTNEGNDLNKLIMLGAATFCIVLLLLPLQGETKSIIPPDLHISVNLKLLCAYIFGVLTVLIVRS